MIAQRARTDTSIGLSASEDSLIIESRLLEDRGWIICGSSATCGNPATPTACVRRSCTTCRASSTSVPGSNVMTTDESPGSDTDSISSRKATPASRSCSSGTVISCSTSSAESPRASVWTSTIGGLNSGRTSTGVLPAWITPTITRPTAAATTRRRNLRLEATIQRIMAGGLPRSSCPLVAAPVRGAGAGERPVPPRRAVATCKACKRFNEPACVAGGADAPLLERRSAEPRPRQKRERQHPPT